MANLTVPNIDMSICSAWTEQDRNLYNKLPFYLQKMNLKYMRQWNIWSDLIDSVKWSPNMGTTMRRVSKEPSPVLRQFAFPNPIQSAPLKDIMDVRERSVDAIIFKHRFESLVLNFLPSFQDFLTDGVNATDKDISEKETRFHNYFIRGHVFNQSPFVFLPNAAIDANGDAELKSAPYSDSVANFPVPTYDAVNKQTTITGAGKTTAYLQQLVTQIGNPGNLSLNAINIALCVLETDLNIPPYMGSGGPAGDNAPLDRKYVLVTSGEAYNQFMYDPFLLKYKNIDLDIIAESFRGSLFGRVTCRLEDQPIRFTALGVFPDPETRELNPNAYNYGESVPNKAYVIAPYEVAFLMGYADGYSAIEVGPPPKEFAGGGMPKGYGNMQWNGEVIMTKNILIPCLDAGGNQILDTNKYGEAMQLIAQTTLGIVGQQKRSIIPIIFKRKRGAENAI